MKKLLSFVFAAGLAGIFAAAGEKPCVSGIYPNLAMFNNEGECGTGAVVPWADRLWVVTYAPHAPNGSSDKLYEITPELDQIIRPESIGGTVANRMIHGESGQLFIGPYAVDAQRRVRVIPFSRMFGRLTANMRHLSDPAHKIYCATMEEGFYEIDVDTLDVTELYRDGNRQKDLGGSLLPGYHGKGAYSGQGRVVYANNGEHSAKAMRDPTTESGVLAEWDGKRWSVVRRNQFTEVTGPGGIYGNQHPESDPIWSIGWDYRSLILMVLDKGVWHAYRLPKGSHSYDGAHGWNTEWPRIREIGSGEMLMTMHGTFWHFPKTMSAAHSSGLKPRSNYLKVIGDFCRWKGRVVFGCDDSPVSQFMNKRLAKGPIKGAGQSNSNLWFVDPEAISHFGPAIGRGAVWMGDSVKGGRPSDAYLLDGYDRRVLYVAHDSDAPVPFVLEIDRSGNGQWQAIGTLSAAPGRCTEMPLTEKGAWIRLVPQRDAPNVYACFHYANTDARPDTPDARFAGLATRHTAAPLGGLVYSRGGGLKTLGLAAVRIGTDGKLSDVGFYQLDAALKLKKVKDPNGMKYVRKNYGMEGKGLTVEAASALMVDNGGKRWRFPKASAAFDGTTPFGEERLCREVCTERDLLNVCGIFYELPAENAGGFSKVRAIATHGLRIHDYCSWRGLLVMTGIDPAAKASGHIIRSEDGRAAVWAGVADDLWAIGKARGVGGPWLHTPVKAGMPSDPYLMTGFDKKTLTLSQTGAPYVKITLELDLTGTGVWKSYKTYTVEERPVKDTLDGARAYWLRVRSDTACTATAQLEYE